jgi:hypothetical protein
LSSVRFFGDEHVRRSLADALWHREAAIEFTFVGDAGCPPSGTPDPGLLRFAEANKLALITGDRRTMPDHVADHLATGAHTWGVFLIKRGATWHGLVDDLLLIWSASDAEDWCDRIERLPW